jgi:hypothetical protein
VCRSKIKNTETSDKNLVLKISKFVIVNKVLAYEHLSQMYNDPHKVSEIKIKVPEIRVPEAGLEYIQREKRAQRAQEMTDHGYAHVLYERLVKQINDFEAKLNPDEEIAAYLSSFGQTMLIKIENLGYHNPFFIVFYGSILDDGRQVQLVQHTTQLNVLFTAIKLSPEENRPARRIGFSLDNQV